VIPAGSRDKAGSIRGPRLIFVIDGRSLVTRLPNGSKGVRDERGRALGRRGRAAHQPGFARASDGPRAHAHLQRQPRRALKSRRSPAWKVLGRALPRQPNVPVFPVTAPPGAERGGSRPDPIPRYLLSP
jgi:hypothetical protein